MVSWRPRLMAAWSFGAAGALALAIAILASLFLLGGCLQGASDQDYDFDNPNDTTPDDDDDGDFTGTLAIALVMDLDDIVVIVNQTTTVQDLDGWVLQNTAGDETFLFPAFELGQGDFVRAHTNDTGGTDGESDVYASGTDTVDWGGTNDSALLVDDNGDPVADCDEGELCWP